MTGYVQNQALIRTKATRHLEGIDEVACAVDCQRNGLVADIADIDRIASDARIRGGGRVEVRAFDAADRASHAVFVADLPRRPFNVFLAFGLMVP